MTQTMFQGVARSRQVLNEATLSVDFPEAMGWWWFFLSLRNGDPVVVSLGFITTLW